MSDRIVSRLLCSKKRNPHVLGRVLAEPSGRLLLRYKEAMRVDTTGRDDRDFETIDCEYIPEPNVSAGSDAYCTTCKQRYFVPMDGVFAAAARGARVFRLQGRNAEAAWRPKRPRTD